MAKIVPGQLSLFACPEKVQEVVKINTLPDGPVDKHTEVKNRIKLVLALKFIDKLTKAGIYDAEGFFRRNKIAYIKDSELGFLPLVSQDFFDNFKFHDNFNFDNFYEQFKSALDKDIKPVYVIFDHENDEVWRTEKKDVADEFLRLYEANNQKKAVIRVLNF